MYPDVALGDGYHRTMLQFIPSVCEDLDQRSNLGTVVSVTVPSGRIVISVFMLRPRI